MSGLSNHCCFIYSTKLVNIFPFLAINTLYSNLGHFQYAVIKSKQSHTFSVNAICWFVLHGNTDKNGSLFAGDVRGRLYTLCGDDSSTNVLVSFDDGKLTITNNINWAEVFIVLG